MALHKLNTIGLVVLLILTCVGFYNGIFFPKHSINVNPNQVEYIQSLGDSTFSMFEVDGGTFNANIDVISGSDKAKAIRYVNSQLKGKYTVGDLDGVGGMTFYNEGGGQLIIWVEKLDTSPNNIAYTEHEVLHAVIYIMKFSGITLADQSEEAFTYEMGYITKQIYKHVKY